MSGRWRHPVVLALLGVGLAFGLVLAYAVVQALAAARNLEAARSGLTALDAEDSPTDEVLDAVLRAEARARRADRRLHSWPVDVAAALPVLGRSFDVERLVARTAAPLLRAAAVSVQRLPQVQREDGSVDVTALAALRQQLVVPTERAERAAARLQDASTALTPPQVRRAHADATAALGPAVEALSDAQGGLLLAESLLGGDGQRNVLVALENNAELRGTGGYVASFATGRIAGGRLDLDPLRSVTDVADPPERARRVEAPPEFREDYGPLSADTTVWRSWNMSPDVPQSAQVGARIAGVLLGTEPDVMVMLDVPAMGELAALQGDAVALPGGREVSPDELTDALLVDAYAEAGAATSEQRARRAELQEAATRTVSGLLSGEVPLLEAARTVRRLADGRHLKLWSARAEEQARLEQLGLAGSLDVPEGSDFVHVAVNNIGANKLDQYVRREHEHEVVLHEGWAEVTHTVRFTNEAPADLVPYVAGRERPGTARSLVEVSLPAAASLRDAAAGGTSWTGYDRVSDNRRRLATRLEIAPGGVALVTLKYDLPALVDRYRLHVVPQPLVQDAVMTVKARRAGGEHRRVDSGSGSDWGTALPLGRDEDFKIAPD